MKVYFISGLGADRRAFYKIQLPPGFEAVHLDWISPQRGETLEHYARRFAIAIPTNEEFALVGLSFGGMLASELAKIISPKVIIIISSLANARQLPWYFRLAGRLGVHRILTPSVYKSATILNRFLGAGDQEMKAIVYSYVHNIDPAFIKWSLHVIVHWQHNETPTQLVHIHGSRDHLLPCRYVKADYIVRNGGHLMVMSRAAEVNKILEKILTAA